MTAIRTTSLSLAVIGLLAACSEDGNGGFANPVSDLQTVMSSGQSKEQRELSSLQRQYATMRLQAGAGGAVAGAVSCLLTSCSDEELALRTVGGGIAGYLAGGYLTNRDAEFRGTQETLQSDIKVAREDNARLSRAVELASVINTNQQNRIRTLNSSFASGTTTVSQYRAELRSMESEIGTVRSMREEAQDNVAGLDQSIRNHSGVGTASLQRERSQQAKRVNQLVEQERQMLANIARAPAEVEGS